MFQGYDLKTKFHFDLFGNKNLIGIISLLSKIHTIFAE